jgi:outer membrane receptor for Fe3+-dicitrate
MQMDVAYTLGDRLSLDYKGYFEDYSQQQYEFSQRYYNNIQQSYNFENRFELHGKFGGHEFVAGASYRFMHVLAYGDFFNEYLNATDITTNPAGFQINQLFGVVLVPGTANQFAAPGASYASGLYPFSINNTQKQNSHQVGLFFQDIWAITDQLSVLGGVRGDFIHENLVDPLPPPGFAGARADLSAGEGAADVSVTFKPVSWDTAYATVNFNQSPVTSNGGGFAAFTGQSIAISDFHINNWLYEVGDKLALDDNRLFVSTAAFYQERAQTDIFGVTSKVRSLGYELEANYQPDKNFSAAAAASYLDAWLPHASPTAFTQNVYDAFAPPYGTAAPFVNGSPNFNPLPQGTYRLPGVPRALFSTHLKYRTDLGVGASLGAVVTGPVNTSYLGNVQIPTQYTIDTALFYETTSWEVRLDLYNITDQKNWVAEAGPQGNDLITAALPFHVQGTVSYKF